MDTSDVSKKISVTHINIRTSIFFLVIKLVIVEVIGVFLMLTFFLPLCYLDCSVEVTARLLYPSTITYFLFIGLKMFLSILVIFQWINEYYEINLSNMRYRRGFFFKKIYEYSFAHITSLEIQQEFLGRLFNYGTIHMYDRQINKHVYIYLIHNPKRYYRILSELITNIDRAEKKTRERLIEDDE